MQKLTIKIPQTFYAKENTKSIIYLFLIFFILLLSGSIAHYFNLLWLYILAFIVSGAAGQALSILQHEAVHRLLFSNKKSNDAIGIILSGILFIRFFEGKNLHLKHHREVGQDSDPNEYWHNTSKRKSGWPIAGFFIFQLFGGRIIQMITKSISLIKLLFKSNLSSHEIKNNEPTEIKSIEHLCDFASIIFSQAAIFFIISVISSPLIYFLFYLLPLLTLTPFLEGIKNFSEHALPGKPISIAEENRLFFINASRFERLFLGHFSFHFHHIHHLYPDVATFKLPELHKWLVKEDPRYNEKYITRPGYFETVLRYVFKKPIPGSGAFYP